MTLARGPREHGPRVSLHATLGPHGKDSAEMLKNRSMQPIHRLPAPSTRLAKRI